MIIETAISISLLLGALPALLFTRNRRRYLTPSRPDSSLPLPPVSVLIPARDEQQNIGNAVRSVLANAGVELEVLVLDDHSQDETAHVVEELSTKDRRVQLLRATPLPEGWCGKQHACATLAAQARHPVLVFMDADVRLAPDALPRMLNFLHQSGASLISGVPHQQLGTFTEKLLLPLIHFVLLGFLPFGRMRRGTEPAYAAGCGQLFMAKARDYHACGGHRAIRNTLHDGVRLPRAFRDGGFKTDLFDATTVAACRMYLRARDVLAGLAKNATEGLAAPARILPVTMLLLFGQVLPFLLLVWPDIGPGWRAAAAVGVATAWWPRALACRQFKQPAFSAILHPAGVLMLLGIQWFAFIRQCLGRPSVWRGRAYGRAIAMMLFVSVPIVPAQSVNDHPRQIRAFTLADQHGKTRRFEFPKTNISFVVVADQKGSAQLQEWIAPAQERFGNRIDIDGVADMSAVPGPLREIVRTSFGRQVTHPVMLDWDGTVCARFTPRKGSANVYVLNREGVVIRRWTGVATTNSIAELSAVIESELKNGPR